MNVPFSVSYVCIGAFKVTVTYFQLNFPLLFKLCEQILLSSFLPLTYWLACLYSNITRQRYILTAVTLRSLYFLDYYHKLSNRIFLCVTTHWNGVTLSSDLLVRMCTHYLHYFNAWASSGGSESILRCYSIILDMLNTVFHDSQVDDSHFNILAVKSIFSSFHHPQDDDETITSSLNYTCQPAPIL